ncbi:MAG: glycosyltransferase family 2 protein [Thaumarchaeota archaeon]|jgi:cellulose synthase/poly-beta-1,6-N-acetylglucosamine synthase-like glycosyltransferase|nr:glycosyltransferase family 2 protein [Candidatus Terraquivivens yellowstonensis]
MVKVSSFNLLVFGINLALIPLMLYIMISVAGYFNIGAWDFVLIFLPAFVLDYARAIGKSVILPIYEIIRKPPQLVYTPMISVIIPTHNNERTIAACITSILENDYKFKEIIVVDDGSTDRTYDIASNFKDKIKLLSKPKGGIKTYALNYGLTVAKGDIVVTVDADTLISRDALSKIVAYFSDPRILAASGNLRVLNGNKNLLTRLQSYEYVIAFDIGRRLQALFRTLLIIPGAKSIVRKRVLEAIGGFDPVLGEDFDLTLKVHKIRGRVIFIPECYAFTEVPETWRSWFRQRERWHRSQIRVLIRHRNIFFRRIFGRPSILGAPDMVLMDMLAIFIRPTWFAYFMYAQNIVSVGLLLVVFYFIVELHTVLSAFSVLEFPSDLRDAYLLPLLTLFYRPIYSLVRFYAYVAELIKPSTRW